MMPQQQSARPSLLQRAKGKAFSLLGKTASFLSHTILIEGVVAVSAFTLYHLQFIRSGIQIDKYYEKKSDEKPEMDPVPVYLFITASFMLGYRVLPKLIRGFWHNTIPKQALDPNSTLYRSEVKNYLSFTSTSLTISKVEMGLCALTFLTHMQHLLTSPDMRAEERTLITMRISYIFMYVASGLLQKNRYVGHAELKNILAQTKAIAVHINLAVSGLQNNGITAQIIEDSFQGFSVPMVKLTIADADKHRMISQVLTAQLTNNADLCWPVIYGDANQAESQEIYIIPFAVQANNLPDYLTQVFRDDISVVLAGSSSTGSLTLAEGFATDHITQTQQRSLSNAIQLQN